MQAEAIEAQIKRAEEEVVREAITYVSSRQIAWREELPLLHAVVRLNTLRGVELAVQAAQEQEAEAPV